MIEAKIDIVAFVETETKIDSRFNIYTTPVKNIVCSSFIFTFAPFRINTCSTVANFRVANANINAVDPLLSLWHQFKLHVQSIFVL